MTSSTVACRLRPRDTPLALAGRAPEADPLAAWSVAMSVPQRRQGSPARPYTHSSRPRRVLPVVVRFTRNRLAHSICCARVTMRSGSDSVPTVRAGQAPEHEAQFVGVHVPDTGHHALIQKCLGKGPLRVGGQVGRRGGRRPVRPQQVRAEMRDGLQISGTVEDFEHARGRRRWQSCAPTARTMRTLCAAARTLPIRQLPSIFRCEWMLAGPTRMNRCLPRLSTSSTAHRTGRPPRTGAPGHRTGSASCPPARRAACGRSERRCRPRAFVCLRQRSRKPRGVLAKPGLRPAPRRRVESRMSNTGTPSTRSTSSRIHSPRGDQVRQAPRPRRCDPVRRRRSSAATGHRVRRTRPARRRRAPPAHRPCGPAGARVGVAHRPRQRGAVRVGRVGRGQSHGGPVGSRACRSMPSA